MKKLSAVLCCFVAAVALAGGYSSKLVTENGNGTNGMTYTPATNCSDAIAPITGVFGGQLQNCAQVTMFATGSNNITIPANNTWLRSYQCAAPGDGGTSVYRRMPQFDIQPDAGVLSLSGSGSVASNSLTFSIGALPVAQGTTGGWLWACENCLQSGAQTDGGMTILTELTTGSGSGVACGLP